MGKPQIGRFEAFLLDFQLTSSRHWHVIKAVYFCCMIENISVTIRPDKALPLSKEDLLAITGLFGIHSTPQSSDNIVVEINPYTDCVRININSALINNLQVVIYTKANYIENQFLRARNSGGRIGVRWVLAQTTEAGRRNFITLNAKAYRADDRSGDWSGYVVWAKYGYVMQVSSIPDFQRFVDQLGRTEKDLHTLISVPDGLELWIAEGFSWNAEFDLSTSSESRKILSEYIARKGSA
jgi:hypothetical protein